MYIGIVDVDLIYNVRWAFVGQIAFTVWEMSHSITNPTKQLSATFHSIELPEERLYVWGVEKNGKFTIHNHITGRSFRTCSASSPPKPGEKYYIRHITATFPKLVLKAAEAPDIFERPLSCNAMIKVVDTDDTQ